MTAFSMIAATTLTSPLQNGHSVISILKTRLSSFAQGMHQRWLGTVPLSCENGFRKVRGYRQIKSVVEEIKRQQVEEQDRPALKIAA